MMQLKEFGKTTHDPSPSGLPLMADRAVDEMEGTYLLIPERRPPLDHQLMLDPARRRRWLLTKALEIAPLTQALALAREAEDFLCGTAGGDTNRTFFSPARTSGAEPEAEPAEQKSLSALAITKAPPMVTTEALVGLSSLVSIDDVIVYLRQAGDDLMEDQSADELLARANLKRAEQGLPTFVLLPGVATRAAVRDEPARTEKVTAPRPPSARERAEWARRVIAVAD